MTQIMKYAVLHFGYNHVAKFAAELSRAGRYSINLGDYMQTLAAREFLRASGVPDEQVITINRDDLAAYDGPPVFLIMNACFYRWSFPIPNSITPVFVGFQAGPAVLKQFVTYFRLHQPIGCRDEATRLICEELGVAAYTSGCLTSLLPHREFDRPEGALYIVHGSGAGAFPVESLLELPASQLREAKLVFQRMIVTQHPLSETGMKDAELCAAGLLEEYRNEAASVVTSLHHAATPCHALGIPVAICRRSDDSRFSFVRKYLPYFVAPDFRGLSGLNPSRSDALRVHVQAAARRAFELAHSGRKE